MTFVDVLWSLFHLLTGTSVRMEHATASSASSDAVEIRLQRHCEMMQDGVAELLSFLLPSFVKLVFPESACEGFFVKKQPLYYIFTSSHLLI